MPIDGPDHAQMLLDHDLTISSAVMFKSILPGGGKTKTQESDVEFQFPPKITSDSKKINWVEKDLKGYEPLALFMGSSPRTINFEAQYVVYGNWTVEKIRNQVLTLKSGAYFGDFNKAGASLANAPYIMLRAYQIVDEARRDPPGVTTSTWRMLSLDIEYSRELVLAEGSEQAIPLRAKIDSAWPLHTKVNMSLALTTNAATLHKYKVNKNEVLQRLGASFPDRVALDWY